MVKKNLIEDVLRVEAILFSYGDWLSVKDINEILKFDDEREVLEVLAEVRSKFDSGFSFVVEENDEGFWRMVLRDDYEVLVSDLISGVEMPSNVLKVLSVIAYEQPVTKTRLAEILGRSAKEEVNFLYKSKFLSYDKKGIGKFYKVTSKFYDYFKIDKSQDFRKQANESLKVALEEPISLDQVKQNKKKRSSE